MDEQVVNLFRNIAIQLQGISTKLGAQGVNQIVQTFSGDASKFNN